MKIFMVAFNNSTSLILLLPPSYCSCLNKYILFRNNIHAIQWQNWFYTSNWTLLRTKLHKSVQKKLFFLSLQINLFNNNSYYNIPLHAHTFKSHPLFSCFSLKPLPIKLLECIRNRSLYNYMNIDNQMYKIYMYMHFRADFLHDHVFLQMEKNVWC